MYIFQPARNEHPKKSELRHMTRLDKLCMTLSCSQDQIFYINSCNSTKILTLIIIIQTSTDIPWFSTNGLYVPPEPIPTLPVDYGCAFIL